MNLEEALDQIKEYRDALTTVRRLRVEDQRRIRQLEDELEQHNREVRAA